jgi:hypothetical protein
VLYLYLYLYVSCFLFFLCCLSQILEVLGPAKGFAARTLAEDLLEYGSIEYQASLKASPSAAAAALGGRLPGDGPNGSGGGGSSSCGSGGGGGGRASSKKGHGAKAAAATAAAAEHTNAGSTMRRVRGCIEGPLDMHALRNDLEWLIDQTSSLWDNRGGGGGPSSGGGGGDEGEGGSGTSDGALEDDESDQDSDFESSEIILME